MISQRKGRNQTAGPPQGLICPYFSGKMYTEAKPRDFLTMDYAGAVIFCFSHRKAGAAETRYRLLANGA